MLSQGAVSQSHEWLSRSIKRTLDSPPFLRCLHVPGQMGTTETPKSTTVLYHLVSHARRARRSWQPWRTSSHNTAVPACLPCPPRPGVLLIPVRLSTTPLHRLACHACRARRSSQHNTASPACLPCPLRPALLPVPVRPSAQHRCTSLPAIPAAPGAPASPGTPLGTTSQQ